MKPTPRETEVLDALIETDGTALAIAQRLDMAESTVQVHLAQMRERLGFKTKVQLAVWWATEKAKDLRPDLIKGTVYNPRWAIQPPRDSSSPR